MSFDARSEFFLDSTLVKFSGDSFGLPENFTVVGVWLKFRQRLPTLGNCSFAVEFRDRLTRKFGLKNVKQNFEIPTFGCLITGPVQADENLLMSAVVGQCNSDLLPCSVGPFTSAEGLDELLRLGGSGESRGAELDAVAAGEWCFRKQFHFTFVEVRRREELGDDFPDFRAFHDAFGVDPYDGWIVEAGVACFV